jgi:hypothetical protein
MRGYTIEPTYLNIPLAILQKRAFGNFLPKAQFLSYEIAHFLAVLGHI